VTPVLVAGRPGQQASSRSQFPGEDPIRRRIRFEAKDLANPAEPGIFVPCRQSGFVGGENAGFVIRTSAGRLPRRAEIRRQVAQVDPKQQGIDAEALDRRLDDAAAQPRLAAVLLGCFGAMGLLLAALGL
jgi:hypothetical protein